MQSGCPKKPRFLSQKSAIHSGQLLLETVPTCTLLKSKVFLLQHVYIAYMICIYYLLISCHIVSKIGHGEVKLCELQQTKNKYICHYCIHLDFSDMQTICLPCFLLQSAVIFVVLTDTRSTPPPIDLLQKITFLDLQTSITGMPQMAQPSISWCDVPGRVTVRINGDRINGLVISPTYKWNILGL